MPSLDQIVLEPSQGLQSEIYFNLTLNLGAGTLIYEPDPQIGGGPVILQSGMNGPFDFPQDTKDQTYQIKISVMDNDGNITASGGAPYTVKATYSVDNSGFSSPDEVWEVGSSATWTPPVSMRCSPQTTISFYWTLALATIISKRTA
jgi:hypothetical protein